MPIIPLHDFHQCRSISCFCPGRQMHVQHTQTLPSAVGVLGVRRRCLPSTSLLPITKGLHRFHTCFRDITRDPYPPNSWRWISRVAEPFTRKNQFTLHSSTSDNVLSSLVTCKLIVRWYTTRLRCIEIYVLRQISRNDSWNKSKCYSLKI
jgi:hypothetical protein